MTVNNDKPADNIEKPKRRPHPSLTIITIAAMLLIGAVIIFLDRKEVVQLEGKANWSYLVIALGFVAASYLLSAISTVVMLRIFGVKYDKSYLLRVGFVSNVLSNLIAIPAAVALRLLVLGRHGVTQSQNIGASLLLSYFKNLVFFMLIPLGLIYIIFSYPLVFGGVAVMILIILILVIGIAVATFIMFNDRARAAILKIAGRVWHFITRRSIEPALNNFRDAVTLGITVLKHKPKSALLLAGLIIGDVAAMIAGLDFCFKALAIPVHLGVLITGFNFGITLTVISFIPGDLGVQEASIAGILAIFGVPFSQGILASILFRVLYYFVPFVVSLGFYWSLLKETNSKMP
ncbi:MAG: flippase-like domain-containing protein [Dehalococcoidales bacterium]|jgi:uncharacterized protein (TIRG00374 family)